MTSSQGTSQYAYDALGNLVATTDNGVTTRYVIDPIGSGNVVGAYNAAGTQTARYTYGYGLVSGTIGANTAYYTFDGTGNTSEVTVAGGVVANQYAYEPFGTTLLSTQTIPNPFQFVGQLGVMTDTNDLVSMRARSYSPDTGRFLVTDPLDLLSGDTNYYRYVANDPVSGVDPSGNIPPGVVVGIVIGGFNGAMGAVAAQGSTTSIIVSAATGAVVGGVLGVIEPTGIGTMMLGTGVLGTLTNCIGQWVTAGIEGRDVSKYCAAVGAGVGSAGATGLGYLVGGLAIQAEANASGSLYSRRHVRNGT